MESSVNKSQWLALEAERTDISYRKSPYRYDLFDQIFPEMTAYQRSFLLAGMYLQGLNTPDAHKAIQEVLDVLDERQNKIRGYSRERTKKGEK
jgi:hypothetical protein